MNQRFVKMLTETGIKVVEEAIKKVTEKISEDSGVKAEKLDLNLIAGIHLKGLSNIYYDIETIKNNIHRKITSIDDLKLIIVNKPNPNNNHPTYERISKGMIKGQYKLKYDFLTEEAKREIVSKLLPKGNPIQIKPTETKINTLEQEETDINKTENFPNNGEGEEGTGKRISFDINDGIDENQPKQIGNLSDLEDNDLIPKDDLIELSELDSQEKRSFIKQTSTGTKKVLSKVTNEISEIKDIFDTIKKTDKFKLLVEVCDLSRDYAREVEYGGEDNHYRNNRNNSNNQKDESTIEMISIYKNDKLQHTISRLELLDFLKFISGYGSFTIDNITTINTIKNEFEPKKKWSYS